MIRAALALVVLGALGLAASLVGTARVAWLLGTEGVAGIGTPTPAPRPPLEPCGCGAPDCALPCHSCCPGAKPDGCPVQGRAP